MIKTLIIGLTPPLEGGSERHIYEISSRIEGTTVLTQKNTLCKNAIPLPTIKKDGFLRNISFFIVSLIYTFLLLARTKKKYEIIHIHENLLYFLIPLLRIRYKVMVTVHGISGFKFYDNKVLWFFFKNSLQHADKIVSVSLADKELLDKDFNNVIYIPNGVNLNTYKQIPIEKTQKKITFVGRIHKQKGVEYLFKAFHELNKQYPKYKLNIIGKKQGDLYEKLKKTYSDKNILWKGFISDRKKLFLELASSEILVFPSLWEALPWPALLEGLGSGRPVIASDLYGMKKIFTNKKDILLVSSKNPPELAKALIFLIRNKSIATKIGKEGYKIAEDYTWDKLAKKVQNLYNGSLASE